MELTKKTVSELLTIVSFADRLEYLKLGGWVGRETFGFDRFINQRFYKSHEWLKVRNHVLLRDNGCDLGVVGYEIRHGPIVHHMNPIALEDLTEKRDWVLDPEFLITTTHDTHNTIHYGVDNGMPLGPRVPGDTTLW